MKILPRALLAFALCVSAFALPALALAQQPARTQAAALLDELDMQATLDQTIVVTLDAQIKAQPQLAPYRQTMLDFFRKYMSYESLKPDMIKIYEEAFTEQELSELRAFYSTPVGRKSLAVVPSLMGKGAEMGQKRVEEHLPELAKMIQEQTDRLKAK
jgi:hypothetical protein